MEHPASPSSLARAAVNGIEQEYYAFQQQCAQAFPARRQSGYALENEAPELVSLMLQTASIHAPYYDPRGSSLKSILRAQVKIMLRWLMRPFIKIALVHQQEMNHLVVLLAESHRILEQKVARLEAAAKAVDHRDEL